MGKESVVSETSVMMLMTLLENGSVLENPSVGFEEVCKAAGADSRSMALLLRSRFGVEPEAFVERYRRQ